jgi:hypothetical protein
VSLFYKANIENLGNKEKLKLFLRLLEAFFRDLYEYRVLNNVLVFDSLLDVIKTISNHYDKDALLKYLFEILELIKKIGYNVNMSLFMNQFLIDLNGGI